MRKHTLVGRRRHHFRGGSDPLPPGHSGHRRQPPAPGPAHRRSRPTRRPPRSGSCSRSTPSCRRRRPTARGPTSASAPATTASTTSASCPTARAGSTSRTSTASCTSCEDRQPSVYLDVKARVPRVPGLARPGLGLRLRHLPPRVRGEREVLHDATPRTRTLPASRPTRASRSARAACRASSPSGPPTTRPPTPSPAPAASCSATASPAQIHAIQQIDFNPTAEPGDDDYGLLYLAVGDGGYGVEQRRPAAASDPVRQDPAHRPGRHRRAQRPVRHPRHQPVGRRARRARRDLGHRHARPAPVQLGRGGQARDVPRPHRPARHRGRLRGRPPATTSAGPTSSRAWTTRTTRSAASTR